MGRTLTSRLNGLFAGLVMLGMITLTTNTALAQVHEPLDLHHHHVDTLMAELAGTLTLTEQQHAQIRALLQEEMDAFPEEDGWTWSPELEEFNQRVEEVLEEHQRVLFREWLQTRPAVTPQEFEEEPQEEIPPPPEMQEEPEQRHHHEQEGEERERPPRH